MATPAADPPAVDAPVAGPGPGDPQGARPDLTARARAVGAVAWASFLAAGVGTMFFFAFIAPEDLLSAFPENDHIDRIGVYTLGFFGLWCLSALASALALYVYGQLLAGHGRQDRPGARP
jgi:hypothetical protein